MMDGVTETRMINTGRTELEVQVNGSGPMVVLLPSLGRDSYEFEPIAQDLADAGLCAVRPQPRGVGASGGPLEDLDLHDLAGDVADVLVALEGAPAILAGHAFGHYVARVLAVDRPDLVRGVAVLAAGARRFPASLTERVAKCSDLTLPDSDRLVNLREVFFADGHDPSVWLEGWWPDAIASQRAAMSATDKESWWPLAPSPLLDVQAGDDVFRPPETRAELVDQFGSELVSTVLIPGSGHALIPEAPHEVAAALVEWIRTLA
jgi:pimeloyl-ACP methyl ester carboxylesterase